MTVRIRDDDDVTRVQFNQPVYRSTDDAITVIVDRLGDLRSESQIGVRCIDGGAKEGKDFVLKTRRLIFAPHQKTASIQLDFLARNTWPKSFQLVLDPKESVNAALVAGSQTTATVFIPPSATSGPALLPAEPIVVSLMDYGKVQFIHSNDTLTYKMIYI